MATPNDVAQRLGIPPSQVTARGLLDHAFPGVVDCIPAGPSRDAFVNGLGASLLQAALDDDASDPFRYNGQLQMIQHVLDQPEMQQVLAHCRQQGGAPGATPSPTGSGDGGAGDGPGPIGVGTILAALGLTAAVGTMLWWVTRRRPDEPARGLPGRSNPPKRSGSYEGPLSLPEHLKSIGVDELISVEWGSGRMGGAGPVVRVIDTATGRILSRRQVSGPSMHWDAFARSTVEEVALQRLASDPTLTIAVNMHDRSYELVREVPYCKLHRGRMMRDGVQLQWGDENPALAGRSNPPRERKVGYDVSVKVGKEWTLVGNEEDYSRATRWALKIAADRKTDARVKSEYGVEFTAHKDGSYRGKLDPEPDYGDGQGL